MNVKWPFQTEAPEFFEDLRKVAEAMRPMAETMRAVSEGMAPFCEALEPISLRLSDAMPVFGELRDLYAHIGSPTLGGCWRDDMRAVSEGMAPFCEALEPISLRLSDAMPVFGELRDLYRHIGSPALGGCWPDDTPAGRLEIPPVIDAGGPARCEVDPVIDQVALVKTFARLVMRSTATMPSEKRRQIRAELGSCTDALLSLPEVTVAPRVHRGSCSLFGKLPEDVHPPGYQVDIQDVAFVIECTKEIPLDSSLSDLKKILRARLVTHAKKDLRPVKGRLNPKSTTFTTLAEWCHARVGRLDLLEGWTESLAAQKVPIATPSSARKN